jgi:alkaline phosphatase
MSARARSLGAGRSGRLRLLALAVGAVVVVVLVIIITGVAQDRMAPGTGDTAGTPAPDAGPSSLPGTAVRLVAVGDVAECASDGDERTGALAASLPGTIAILGDTAYDRGTRTELAQCFGASWGPVKDRIAWAVSGNHDYMTDDGAPLREYMGAAAVRDGRTYFADALGPWHVVVLDTNCDKVDGGCGPDSPQVAWLRDDLAASGARCTVALYHHPRWSSGYHGDTRSADAIWRTLADGGVDLVLNGHEHDYERFAPLDASGAEDPSGVVEIVAGTGGGDLRGFRSPPAPGSLVRKSSVFGLVEAMLADGSWSIRFVDADGQVVDRATGTCR